MPPVFSQLSEKLSERHKTTESQRFFYWLMPADNGLNKAIISVVPCSRCLDTRIPILGL